jgi:hypothetical protein
MARKVYHKKQSIPFVEIILPILGMAHKTEFSAGRREVLMTTADQLNACDAFMRFVE